MRHQEILRARFEWLDVEKRRLFIPRAKGGRREQPITPELAELLQRGGREPSGQKGMDIPLAAPDNELDGSSRSYGQTVSEGRHWRWARSQDRDAARHAAHRNHEARTMWCRSANHPEHQWTQVACDGPALHARPWQPYRRGDRRNRNGRTRTESEQNPWHSYTGITQRFKQGDGARKKPHQNLIDVSAGWAGSGGRIRTADTRIMIPLL